MMESGALDLLRDFSEACHEELSILSSQALQFLKYGIRQLGRLIELPARASSFIGPRLKRGPSRECTGPSHSDAVSRSLE
jgi:hypothetical protein